MKVPKNLNKLYIYGKVSDVGYLKNVEKCLKVSPRKMTESTLLTFIGAH